MSYKATIVICHVPKHAGFFMDDLLAQVGFQFFRLLQECQIQPFFFLKISSYWCLYNLVWSLWMVLLPSPEASPL